MFHLKQLFRIGKSAPAAPPKSALLASESIKLVAITQNQEDRKSLRDIAASFAWNISIVDSSAAAVDLLQQQPTPLVICDGDLNGEDWRAALSRIAALPQAVCVLLASRVTDEYLRNEVTRCHGYDIVIKPFQREELRRAVTFAWSWRGWTSRHRAGVLRTPDRSSS